MERGDGQEEDKEISERQMKEITPPLFTEARRRGILGTPNPGYCIERRLKAVRDSLLGASTPGEGSHILWCRINMQDRECSTATG
jgi:hypothetical protein